MILEPFFASSTGYGSTKNLLSLPFQAPVFFDLGLFSQPAYPWLTFLKGNLHIFSVFTFPYLMCHLVRFT